MVGTLPPAQETYKKKLSKIKLLFIFFKYSGWALELLVVSVTLIHAGVWSRDHVRHYHWEAINGLKLKLDPLADLPPHLPITIASRFIPDRVRPSSGWRRNTFS
jgi:hypothetical protein